MCYVTQHISLETPTLAFGFFGFFFFGITSLSQEGQFGRNPKRTEVASLSRWRVKTGGPMPLFLIMVSRHRQVSRLQETRGVMSPRAPNTFQCEQTPILCKRGQLAGDPQSVP